MQALYSQNERKFLLKLARDAIKNKLSGKRFLADNVSKKLKEKRAVFVTLTINGELRGCIGSLEAREGLYKDVINNAVNAAFSDSRFFQLTKEEFSQIKIEISVLTPMKRFNYKTDDELVKFLEKEKPGVYIKKGFYSATYLPQVWEHFSSASDFLDSLCEKAGLDADEWKTGRLDVSIYNVEQFNE